ncbi:elongation factor Ts, partial [Candidatus Uhrbacteria bacterium]|nr:elongation factor Ts [Candidatus Uhrbacteria bacterium]
MIDPKLIAQLRAQTGAGIVDCQKALTEGQGDYEKAVDLLRKKGQKVSASKLERETREGIVHTYTHMNGKVGAMVEVLCETDFVARNEDFKQFAHDIVLQIVATNPLFLRPEDVPIEVIDKEKEIYKDQMAEEKKPEEIKEKIITGKLQKYYQEVCLMKQPFIKDDSLTIE